MGTKVLQPDGTYCYKSGECKKHPVGGNITAFFSNDSLAPKDLQPVKRVKKASSLDAADLRNKKIAQYVATIIPREDPARAKYFGECDLKHCDPNEPGSTFTDPRAKTINFVVEEAIRQRGNTHGDDRQKFIDMHGADANAFKDGNRYLMVNTPGTVGIKNTKGLPDDTMVTVTRTKTGAPCSIVLKVKEQDTTDYAVIVITKDFLDPERKKDLVITTFPGLPTAPTANDELDKLEGQDISLAQLRKITGKETWLNTKLVS